MSGDDLQNLLGCLLACFLALCGIGFITFALFVLAHFTVKYW